MTRASLLISLLQRRAGAWKQMGLSRFVIALMEPKIEQIHLYICYRLSTSSGIACQLAEQASPAVATQLLCKLCDAAKRQLDKRKQKTFAGHVRQRA